MHPFASAAAETNAIPRITVQRISGFMAALRKKQSLQQAGLRSMVPGKA
jgi:hypothetical protein